MKGRIKKKKEKREQILSNFRQNQQCSLSQVGCLMVDNIFSLA
jgi:quinol monooxygenase YgiN